MSYTGMCDVHGPYQGERCSHCPITAPQLSPGLDLPHGRAYEITCEGPFVVMLPSGQLFEVDAIRVKAVSKYQMLRVQEVIGSWS